MDQQTYTHDGYRSAQHIAAQLERDRSAFAQSLDALRDRFSLDTLLADGTALLRQNAGPYTQAIDRAVRGNPVALGLTAVGVAWLILGRRQDEPPTPALAGTRIEAMARWEDEGGPVAPLPDVEADDAAWISKTDTLRARAADLIAKIDRAARDRLAPAAALASSRADVLAALAQDVARTIATGLDDMAETARAQTIAARHALYAARQQAAELTNVPVRAHPALSGALLAAGGAALAAYLPQTQMEHRILGPLRDRVLDLGKTLVREEQHRLAAAVAHLSQDLQSDIGSASATGADPSAIAH